jgi:hypothetical protein
MQGVADGKGGDWQRRIKRKHGGCLVMLYFGKYLVDVATPLS